MRRITKSFNDCAIPALELAARKVGPSCHICFAGANYSVPSALYKQKVFIRATPAKIDILSSDGKCIASHKRCFIRRAYITEPSHMPAYYLSFLDPECYDGAKLKEWANAIGHCTFSAICSILEKPVFEEHAYKTCMAILQLSKKYGSKRLDEACAIASFSKHCSYSGIKKILMDSAS